MSSEVEICNIGLQALGAARIASLTDTSVKNAREMAFAYAPTRLAALRAHPWAFAIKRARLAADSTGPLFGFSYAYPFPADMLRLLLPGEPGTDWAIEGKSILSDWSAPLEIRYIRDVDDPNDMDALFRQVLGLRLALATCEAITQSNSKIDRIAGLLADVLREARRTNAIEQLPKDFTEDTWITART